MHFPSYNVAMSFILSKRYIGLVDDNLKGYKKKVPHSTIKRPIPQYVCTRDT